MIKLEHVSKSYSAGIPALNDVSLNIEEGEVVFVVGDSVHFSVRSVLYDCRELPVHGEECGVRRGSDSAV